MDIAALSMTMASMNVQQQAGILVMGLAKEQIEQNGAQVVESIKQMNASLTPHLGQNIDISV